jgi:hypothetical protein
MRDMLIKVLYTYSDSDNRDYQVLRFLPSNEDPEA